MVKSLSALTLSKSSFQSSIGSEIDTSFLTLSDNSSANLETMQNVKSIVLSMESKNRIPTGEESMNFMHLLNNYSINLHTKGVDFGRTQKNIKGFRKKIEALNAIHQRIENNIKAVLANTQISNKKKVEMINQHKNQVKHNGLEDFDFII